MPDRYTSKNTQRIKDQAGSNFYGKNNTVANDDRYWLRLMTPSNMIISNAIVYFEGGDNGFAKDDSKETGTSDALFTYASDSKVVINGRSAFNVNDILDLGTRHYNSGYYKISLGDKEGIFASGQAIYLKDKQTGIVTNLTESAYTFAATAGETMGRFEIVYVPGTVLATDSAINENLMVYKDGHDFVVKAHGTKISALEVYDSAGRLIMNLKPNSLQARIHAEAMANGVYILMIVQNGEIRSRKIVR